MPGKIISDFKNSISRKLPSGQMLVELLIAIGLAALLIPTLMLSLMSSRDGKVREKNQTTATTFLKETAEAVRAVQKRGWSAVPPSSPDPYHPEISGGQWTLVAGSPIVDGLKQEVIISDVRRDDNGDIVDSGGTLDPSTKKTEVKISWTQPTANSISSIFYMTKTLNYSSEQTTVADFNAGTIAQTVVVTGTPSTDGEVILGSNNKAKWCAPEFSNTVIDLTDADLPVAVAATASATTDFPNDVLVATSPITSSAVKMAYVKVTANGDDPVGSMQGIFTLDPTKYSGSVPSGIGLDNIFKTNGVKYYRSSSGKKYALMTTDLPDKEVIVVLVDDNDPGDGEYADTQVGHPEKQKIYKYHTFFNTQIHAGSGAVTSNLDTGDIGPTANGAVTAVGNGNGNGYESTPNEAHNNGGNYATDNNSGNDNSINNPESNIHKDRHVFYGYNFLIPSGAAITGINVRLDSRVANSCTSNPHTRKIYAQLSWDGGNNWTTGNKTHSGNLSTSSMSDGTLNIGGSSDTWGRVDPWTPSEFNTPNNLRLRLTNVANSTTCDFRLDWAAVKVYYSLSDTGYDHSPYGHGGTAMTILEEANMGYVASGGFLYAFDLSNIDSKSTSSGLDMVGCRIQLDAQDCDTGKYRKYSSGNTGTNWGAETVHYVDGSPSCVNGGNTENYATNDIDAVRVGTENYIFAAVGFWTNPELNIINATNVPSGTTTPRINQSACGTFSGDLRWRRVGDLDFNDINDGGISEEASNSIFVRSDGNRAYMSSNGGVDADGNGDPDSKQFYIIDTEVKDNPKFLDGDATGEPAYGYYYGGSVSKPPNTYRNDDLYPRRSLTVLNGQRAVIVGADLGTLGDAEEYQVLDIENENTSGAAAYCSGVNHNDGINDLTSVSEADYDNFVYLVTNTTSQQLRIIQGGPEAGIYIQSGQFESGTIDTSLPSVLNRFTANVEVGNNSRIDMQIAAAPKSSGACPVSSSSYQYLGPDNTSDTFFTTTGNTISDQIPFGTYGASPQFENPAECFRYKAWLYASPDQQTTPKILNFFLNYSQ